MNASSTKNRTSVIYKSKKTGLWSWLLTQGTTMLKETEKIIKPYGKRYEILKKTTVDEAHKECNRRNASAEQG